MATLISKATGNFTTAGTWAVADATSLSDSEVSTGASTTSFVSSAAFTPGAITIDGIGLKISNRTTSATGTFSVRLALAGVAVTGTTVTINATDLVASPSGTLSMSGWAFFKFTAPVTLLAATAYTVQLSSSVANTITIFRSATASDWSRFLRTTTTQSPAAGDNLNICGEYTGAGTFNTLTVTMNNTAATVFGKIETSGKGILSYGTAASTNYQLIGGSGATSGFFINGDGIVQIGTSGTPIPATSTALLQINQNAVTVTNGILLRGTGNLTTFGKTVTQKAFLNADASVAATSLTTDISTGWKNGDLIALASTTRTSADSETKALTADASGTTLTITALTNAHSGTAATKAEVANLTRNVKISGQSAALNSWINLGLDSSFNISYSEVFFMGSSTANKRGVDVATIGGNCTVDNSVWRDFTVGSNFGFLINAATIANVSITNTTFYNLSTGLSLNSNVTTATTITVNNILAILCNLTFNAQAASVTNVTNVSGSISIAVNAPLTGFFMDNIVSHSAPATGISFSGISQDTVNVSNITTWRGAVRGIQITATNLAIDGLTTFGNGTYGLELNQCSLISINNYTANAGTTLLQPSAINLTTGTTKVLISNSSFGATTTFASGDVAVSAINFNEVYFTNCLFSSSTEVTTQGNLHTNSILSSIKHDQTAGLHKIWKKYGTITSDSTINATAPLSQRLTPSSATYKLITNNKTFAIPSGKTAKVTVGVRRSVAGDGTAYNGNLPNLWLRSNNSAGISTDTLLATASGTSLGSWEYITGTIPASTDSTVNSVYIDCDGTTGWVNIDVWKLEIINGSAMSTNINGEDYWQDGISFPGVNTLILSNTGQETYWINDGTASEIFPVSATETGKYFLLFN